MNQHSTAGYIIREGTERKLDPETIAASIEEAKETERLIKNKKDEILRANRLWDNQVSELKKELKALQAACKHPANSYHGDPAGGSDSFHECRVCGYHL